MSAPFTAKAYSRSNPTLNPFEVTWDAPSGENGMKTFMKASLIKIRMRK